MDILSNTTPKARKQYKCNFCLLPIIKGEKHDCQVVVYDGIYTWRSHFECGLLAHALKLYDDCDEGVTDDLFHEAVIEEYRTIIDTWNPHYDLPEFRIMLEAVKKKYLPK